jgi:hypothetical protein
MARFWQHAERSASRASRFAGLQSGVLRFRHIRPGAPSARQHPDAGQPAAAAEDDALAPSDRAKEKTGAEAPVGSNEESPPV